MKKTVMMLVALVLIACGGGGSDSVGRSAEVSGNIYNLHTQAALTPVILNAVSAGQMIEVSTTVTNDGGVALANLSYGIQIEDATFLTPERWSCLQCFPDGSGEVCNTVWEIEGGTLDNPQPAPILPACARRHLLRRGCVFQSQILRSRAWRSCDP